jgi:predicted deacylase
MATTTGITTAIRTIITRTATPMRTTGRAIPTPLITKATAMTTESKPRVRVELTAPDITTHRTSATGVDYVHSFDSGAPGPHVMVNALTHGNEICGAIVVDRMLRQGVRPVRGRLTLAFANVAAFLRFDPANPYATRFVDEDFNRVWTPSTLDGSRRSTELDRARELRPVVDQADFLLDIHSMLEPSPPVMICGPLDKGIRFAFEVGVPRDVVSDVGHANGTRMRDYGGFGDPASPKNALLVECGQHWERAAEAVAWQTTWRFLSRLGVVDAATAAREIDARPVPAQRLIRVTDAVVASSPAFRFARAFSGLDVVERAGDLIAWDGETPVRAPYDNCVLVMPVPNNIKTGLTAVRLGRLDEVPA